MRCRWNMVGKALKTTTLRVSLSAFYGPMCRLMMTCDDHLQV